MKILVVTNFYPPHYVGGYELGCRDVVEGLRQRGHKVDVLTSTWGVDRPLQEGGVHRWLVSDYESIAEGHDPSARLSFLAKKERVNRRAFKQLCRVLEPELIYFWNLKHVSISMPIAAERAPYRVCYFVSDYWLSEWEKDSWYALRDRRPTRASRRLLWNVIRFVLSSTGLLSDHTLQLRHVQFCSRFLADATQRAGKHVKSADVIHWGVDTDTYNSGTGERDARRLLFVGQLIAIKGIETAVNAFHILKQRNGFEDATLTIAGGPDYGNQVQRRIATLGLERDVRMTGLIPRDRLPELYREHGTLLFTSQWDEPFSITVLEAMASGMAVVGTLTGGSREILVDGENALVYEKGDAEGCANQVGRLIRDRGLFDVIRHNARRTIEHRHTIQEMVRKIETSIERESGHARNLRDPRRDSPS
jgi:glycosyltransferase involved in cell wall biosynthesis